MKKRSEIAICYSISKEISVFNATQVGHTVIKLLKIQICIVDANGTVVEIKGPKMMQFCNERFKTVYSMVIHTCI